MAKIKPLTKSDYLVVLATDSNGEGAATSTQGNIWTSCSAFKLTFETSKYNDGESYTIKTLAGPHSYDNITLTRPYDPAVHGEFLQTIEEVREQGKTFTLSITPGKKSTTQEGFVASSPSRKLTLIDCELVSFSMYEVDGASGDTSEMSLEVAPNGHSWEGVSVSDPNSNLQQSVGPSR